MEFKIIKKNKALTEAKAEAKAEKKVSSFIRDSLFGLENNFLVRLNKAKKELNESVKNIEEKLYANLTDNKENNQEALTQLTEELTLFQKKISDIESENNKINQELKENVEKLNKDQEKVIELESSIEKYETETSVLHQLLEQLLKEGEVYSLANEENVCKISDLLERVKTIEELKSDNISEVFKLVLEEKENILLEMKEQIENVKEIENKNYNNLIMFAENKIAEQAKLNNSKIDESNKNLNIGIKNIYNNFLNYCGEVKETLATNNERVFYETDILKKTLQGLTENFANSKENASLEIQNLENRVVQYDEELLEEIKTLVAESKVDFISEVKELVEKSNEDTSDKIVFLNEDMSLKINSLNKELCEKIKKSNELIDKKIENTSCQLFKSIVKEISDKDLYNQNLEIKSLKDEISKIAKDVVSKNKELKEAIEKYNIEIDIDDIEAVIKKNPKLLKNIPDHLYRDGFLQFEKPDGSWGPKIKLFNNVQHIYESIGGGGGNGNGNGNASLVVLSDNVVIEEEAKYLNFKSGILAETNNEHPNQIDISVPEYDIITEPFDFSEYFILKDNKISDKYYGTKINMVMTDENGNVVYENRKYLQ